MKIMLEDLEIRCEDPIKFPIKLFCDNKLTLSFTHNHVQHDTGQNILR